MDLLQTQAQSQPQQGVTVTAMEEEEEEEELYREFMTNIDSFKPTSSQEDYFKSRPPVALEEIFGPPTRIISFSSSSSSTPNPTPMEVDEDQVSSPLNQQQQQQPEAAGDELQKKKKKLEEESLIAFGRKLMVTFRVLDELLLRAQNEAANNNGEPNGEEEEQGDGFDVLKLLLNKGLKLPRPRWWRPQGYGTLLSSSGIVMKGNRKSKDKA